MLDEVEEEAAGMQLLMIPAADHSMFLLLEPEPHKRTLGLVVLRGPTITLLSPVDGSEEIENPFLAAE